MGDHVGILCVVLLPHFAAFYFPTFRDLLCVFVVMYVLLEGSRCNRQTMQRHMHIFCAFVTVLCCVMCYAVYCVFCTCLMYSICVLCAVCCVLYAVCCMLYAARGMLYAVHFMLYVGSMPYAVCFTMLFNVSYINVLRRF